MSHPIPGHDYSEQHNRESNKEYSARRKEGSKSKVHAFDRGSSVPSKKLKSQTDKSLKSMGISTRAEHEALKVPGKSHALKLKRIIHEYDQDEKDYLNFKDEHHIEKEKNKLKGYE